MSLSVCGGARVDTCIHRYDMHMKGMFVVELCGDNVALKQAHGHIVLSSIA